MGHDYSLSDIAAANGGMGNEMWNNPWLKSLTIADIVDERALDGDV